MANILVMFGSTGGNTQSVSEKLQSVLSEAGHQVTVKNVVESTVDDLNNFEVLLMGSSTWNDGELQDDFVPFQQELMEKKPDLSAKKYAAFGCGESIYEKFCGAVDILETSMTELKAQKISDSLKIDGYPEEEDNVMKVENWAREVAGKL